MRRQAIGGAEGSGYGSSRGGDQLAALVALLEHETLCCDDVGNGRHGYGKHAMGRAHATVAFGERGHDDVIDTEVVEAPCGCDDVNDGVDGAYLVEVDLFEGDAVCLRLGSSDDIKDAMRELACAW